MYCPKCGKKMNEDAAFCPFCGAKQRPFEEAKESNTASKETDNFFDNDDIDKFDVNSTESKSGDTEDTFTTNSNNRIKWIVAICVVAAAIIAVVIIIIVSNTRVTIDMNKYLVVDTEGYNGYGSIHYYVDYEKMLEDFSGKLKLTSGREANYDISKYTFMSDEELIDSICSEVSVVPDLTDTTTPYSDIVNNNLSNGETIVLTWDDSNINTLEYYIRVKIIADNYIYTVSGLEEPEPDDFFSFISVNYSGTAPNGTATIEVNENCDWLDEYDFSIDQSSDLSNGDIITVSIDNDSLRSILYEFGKSPIETEKKYTVEGLDEYITSVSQISDDDMAEMKTETENDIKDHLSNGSIDWQTTINDLSFIGCYLVGTFSDSVEENVLYFVYHVNETNDWNNDSHTVDYFIYMAYKNVILKDGGTLYKGDYIEPEYSFEGHEVIGPAFIIDFNGEEVLYRGMESLNDLKTEMNKSGELLDSTLSE